MMRKIECKICHRPPDCPQLKDDVWALIGKPDELLCLQHAEEKLGRHIAPEDLSECPANTYALALAERGCDCP
jgi:hypothetical protein